MGRWIADGRIKWTETILDGIEKAPRAFLDLFAGAKVGKLIARLGPERVA
jgi:NADPH-dependent curcumin reductase CurA